MRSGRYTDYDMDGPTPIRFISRVPAGKVQAIVDAFNRKHGTELSVSAYAAMIFERFLECPDIEQIRQDAKRERNGEVLQALLPHMRGQPKFGPGFIMVSDDKDGKKK